MVSRLTTEREPKTNKQKNISQNNTLKKISGGIFHRSSFCFCRDGTAICLATGCSFTVYGSHGVETNEREHELLANKIFVSGAHDKNITALASHPIDSSTVISASEDGTLKIWDIEEQSLQKTVDIGMPIEQVVYDPKCTDVVYCLCRKGNKRLEEAEHNKKFYFGQVIAVQLSCCEVKNLFHAYCRSVFHLVVSARAIVLATKFGLLIYFLEKTGNRLFHIRHSQTISAVAYHEETRALAVGEESGMIRVFFHLLSTVAEKTKAELQGTRLVNFSHSKFHWHSHGVLSMTFSFNGISLFSGGREGVLVSWKVKTGNRIFLPRLGGSIRHIVTESVHNYIAVLCDHNSLKVLDYSNFNLVSEIRGPWSWTTYRHQELKCDEDDKCYLWNRFMKLIHGMDGNIRILYPGQPGHLQIYDVLEDHEVMQIDVSYFNYQPTSSKEEKLLPYISLLSITEDLTFIITVEEHPVPEEKTFPSEFRSQTLKFYEFNNGSMQYELVSRMFLKSIASFITDMAVCHVVEPILCTLHVDGSFRIWTVMETTEEKQKKIWHCVDSVRICECCPSIATFSRDGSLLVIAYDNILSFWSLNGRTKRVSLLGQKSFTKEPIVSVDFVGGNCGMLIVSTSQGFHVIDFMLMEILWSQQVNTLLVTCDVFSSRFAVVYDARNTESLFSGDHKEKIATKKYVCIAIYEVSNPCPIFLLDAKSIDVKAAFFYISKTCFPISSFLLLVDSDMQFYKLPVSYLTEEESIIETNHGTKIEDIPKQTPYFDILGETMDNRSNEYQKKPSIAVPSLDVKRQSLDMRQFQYVPSHVLPAPRELVSMMFRNNNAHDEQVEKDDDNKNNTLKANENEHSILSNSDTEEQTVSVTVEELLKTTIQDHQYIHYGERLWKKLSKFHKSQF
eukprot:jgi/Galph1/787/GphlegSOOS_G5561.1